MLWGPRDASEPPGPHSVLLVPLLDSDLTSLLGSYGCPRGRALASEMLEDIFQGVAGKYFFCKILF